MASKIIHYPVGNGDNGLISIDENSYKTNIIVDCNICEVIDEKFDIKSDLIKILNKKTVNSVSEVTYADVFILTHGDDDHLHGFEKNFYQGDPKDYSIKHKEKKEIFIDVLWFSPMVMGTPTNDDERCFNKEAKRRIKLHRDNSPNKNLAGNRIVIIGRDANENLSGLNLVRKVPGDIVKRFNERDLNTFSIFIHSPYQEHLSDEEVDKNRTSVVFQARFKANAQSTDFCTLAMFGGDADHKAWATILEKTKKHKNDITEKALTWDLFLAPHHCSWTFFNDVPQDSNSIPVATSIEVLNNKRGTAKIVASSKEIKNNDDNPPHYKAKLKYIEKVGEKNFINLAVANVVNKIPQPVIFEITSSGPMPPKQNEGSSLVSGSAGLGVTTQPSSYGSK